MGILEKVCGAETSKDLKHHHHNCDVDVLGAVGMTKLNSMPVYRLKFLNDVKSYEETLEQFFQWTCKELDRKKRSLNGSKEMARTILHYWLGDVCPRCHGAQRITMCRVCNGTGKKTLNCCKADKEIFETVIRVADCEVLKIKRLIMKKMR